ncbi:MAG: hypothetical protein Q4G25_12850 [Paracoccus sp. (in: a-proteobacteria)]|nr:hypothetical protein [Paracoccus sp. (in: a-proteobacteria)]
MRDFFIVWAERLIAVFAILGMIVVLFVSAMAMAAPGPQGGIVPALLMLIGGAIYVTIMAGIMFVAFGIFRNTQETNRLLAELVNKRT